MNASPGGRPAGRFFIFQEIEAGGVASYAAAVALYGAGGTENQMQGGADNLMEYAEDWSASRAYLSEQSVQAILQPAA